MCVDIGFLSKNSQNRLYMWVAWDVLQVAFLWNQNMKRDTHLKKHRVWNLYFWPPLYTQLTIFLFEIYASFPFGRHSLWNITCSIIKLFIVMMLPSIFQSAHTEHISVPCSQYIIYLVVQGTLFLGRSSLFPKPPRSPYILPSCLVQHPYYVMYVITVSKGLYGKP